MLSSTKLRLTDVGIDLRSRYVTQAAIWHMRTKAKHISEAERKEFAEWLRESPENIAALLRVRVLLKHRRRGNWFTRIFARRYQAIRRKMIARVPDDPPDPPSNSDADTLFPFYPDHDEQEEPSDRLKDPDK